VISCAGHVPAAAHNNTVVGTFEQGLPCIRGTRAAVSAVLGQLAAGRSIDGVIEVYAQLERADVLGALEYATAATRDRETR
jgi:uncharacterized protein (DUF433 family)